MANFDEFFPFDPGYGASANAARWRKMANLWMADGVLANYLNQMNATVAGTTVTVQTGAVFIHGYYAEIINPQTFTVGTGTIVAQVNYANEVVALIYRDTVVDYGTGGFQQDTNVWEIPIWGASTTAGTTTLLDLRNLINPATGLRWWANQQGATPLAASATGQFSFGIARIPYAAQGFLQGTLVITFSDMSQAQSAICQMTYQWGQADQQVSPTITPSGGGTFNVGTSISIPVALTGTVPVTQGKKTFGWRVTSGTGPGIQVSQMTLSLWTGGRPPVV